MAAWRADEIRSNCLARLVPLFSAFRGEARDEHGNVRHKEREAVCRLEIPLPPALELLGLGCTLGKT